MSNKKNEAGIAVIGLGHWGSNLARNFFALGRLKAVYDDDRKTLLDAACKYNIKVYTSLSEVLKIKTIQGVVIATPAETHFEIARKALDAGKHVFVEKPMVLDESEAAALIKLAEQKKRTLMVGHLLQYHTAFIKLKELALRGELGRINYIYSHRLNLGKIRREENILWSFAPHDISMILSLTGEMPDNLLTTGGNYLHKTIADVTTTHLEFPSGTKAHIFVSWLHPFKDQKLVVVGDRKMAVFDDTQPWPDKLLLYPHVIKWENNIPVPAKAEPDRVKDVVAAEPLRCECEHFLQCLETGRVPVTDGREGLRVLRILNASQKSLDQNGLRISFANNTGAALSISKPIEKVDDFFVHETALLDEGVSVGKGTKIWHFSHVLKGSRIGENCSIGQNAVIGPEVDIARNCKIQNNVSVYKGVSLEEGVFCGPSMVFTNVYNPRAEISKMDQVRPTLVKKGASIGANATIVCGVTIGRYAFIGAGSVVNKDIPDHALVVGNPARQIGWVCVCGETLTGKLRCTCGKAFEKIKEGLRAKSS